MNREILVLRFLGVALVGLRFGVLTTDFLGCCNSEYAGIRGGEAGAGAGGTLGGFSTENESEVKSAISGCCTGAAFVSSPFAVPAGIRVRLPDPDKGSGAKLLCLRSPIFPSSSISVSGI